MQDRRWHLDSYDYEGYGVYEQVGQLPTGVDLKDIIANMDAYIVNVGGIQVVKPEAQQPVMEVLDKMDFIAEGDETGPTITGRATYMLMSFGSDFASEYLEDGYAVLAQKASVKTGSPQMLLTKVASVIAQNAAAGMPFVVVAAPPALLQQAQQAGTMPGPMPGPTPQPQPQPQPQVAKATAPEWMLPAVVAVGGLALIAAFTAIGSRKKGAR